MRPSKLRLPESTAVTARSFSLHGRRDLLDQRAGVADAGGAAVADRVEAEVLEVLGEAGLLVVVGDDLRARREGGLHPRLGLEALLHGVAGEQARGEHDRRVRRVRARGDRGDRDRAVVERELLRRRRARPASASTPSSGAWLWWWCVVRGCTRPRASCRAGRRPGRTRSPRGRRGRGRPSA